MKLFQSVRKFYENMGFYPSQVGQKCPFNRRNFAILSILSLTLVCMTSSFLFASRTITEYAESFYVSLTVFVCTVHFLTSFWKSPKIYAFVEKLEEFNENRKFFCEWNQSIYVNPFDFPAELLDDTATAVYGDLIEKIESMSDIIYFVVPKLTTAAYFFPNIMLTLINLYVHDLGDEAYYSAFPIM